MLFTTIIVAAEKLERGKWDYGKLKCNKSYYSYCNSAIFLEYCFSYCYKTLFNFQTYQKFYFDFSQCSFCFYGAADFQRSLLEHSRITFHFTFILFILYLKVSFIFWKKKKKFLIECNWILFFTSLLSYILHTIKLILNVQLSGS